MADFTAAVEVVLRHEGGYANDPNDPGGETHFGISKRSYPDLDIKKLTKEDARAIYRRDFWNPMHLDQLTSELLAGQILDMAVNTGPREPNAPRLAVKLAQKAINYWHPERLEEDGLMGPKTIAELNAFPRRALLYQVYQGLRVAHYIAIVRTRPASHTYATTWARRVFEAT